MEDELACFVNQRINTCFINHKGFATVAWVWLWQEELAESGALMASALIEI